jgi:ADP-ribose pyrophosphatase YjhB (NUDIX family)
MRRTRDQPGVGVGIIVRRHGEVLLLRRSGSHGSGGWSTPGGHLDHGQRLEDCAAREALEETGVAAFGLGSLPSPRRRRSCLGAPAIGNRILGVSRSVPC